MVTSWLCVSKTPTTGTHATVLLRIGAGLPAGLVCLYVVLPVTFLVVLIASRLLVCLTGFVCLYVFAVCLSQTQTLESSSTHVQAVKNVTDSETSTDFGGLYVVLLSAFLFGLVHHRWQ